MPSFFVAIWSVDTCSQTPGSWLLKDFRAKIGGLKLAVEAFSRARLLHGQGSMARPYRKIGSEMPHEIG
jgi:hypothetical protein